MRATLAAAICTVAADVCGQISLLADRVCGHISMWLQYCCSVSLHGGKLLADDQVAPILAGIVADVSSELTHANLRLVQDCHRN